MEALKLTLTAAEMAETKALVAALAGRSSDIDGAELLDEAALAAQELPRRLRRFLRDFRLAEPSPAVCLISGYSVDEETLGNTPRHWCERRGSPKGREEEMFLLLLGFLVGEPIAWSTQQDGQLVHDILPIAGHEQEQLGSGSEQLLWWHVEDAFHPLRGDFLGMMCLRNPDRVATTFACIDSVELSPEHRDQLFQPVFTIRPDESHLRKNSATRSATDAQTDEFEAIEEMQAAPECVPVFFGDPARPYWRLDPYFMDPVPEPEGAQAALDALISEIDRNLFEIALEPGQVCLIDNFRAVHGRRPFRARHDGGDRWLKRINLSCDLRKSRGVRLGPNDRTIHG